jgi:hypothetical protein
MRRALLIAVLAVLMADASGVASLVMPEACAIGAAESGPDSGCPAFCVRCACGCCASAVMHSAPAILASLLLQPVRVAPAAHSALPIGVPLDILHIPKSLLA